eukprot:7887067-Alexandrium_andersonii.AAC.2
MELESFRSTLGDWQATSGGSASEAWELQPTPGACAPHGNAVPTLRGPCARELLTPDPGFCSSSPGGPPSRLGSLAETQA